METPRKPLRKPFGNPFGNLSEPFQHTLHNPPRTPFATTLHNPFSDPRVTLEGNPLETMWKVWGDNLVFLPPGKPMGNPWTPFEIPFGTLRPPLAQIEVTLLDSLTQTVK